MTDETCQGGSVPASPYVLALRERIGSGLLLLPSVTCLVFDDEGGVLLVEHGDTGHWVAPGGSIEPGETPADAAARELWEETGLESVPRRILGVFGGAGFVVRYRNGDEVAYVMTVFECEVTGGELRPDGDEVRQTRFFGVRDLPEGLSSWAQRVLPVVMAERLTASFERARWCAPQGNLSQHRNTPGW
jgi:8-oxo-dGTP pyrophosphatase MutT (NUDIX family)